MATVAAVDPEMALNTVAVPNALKGRPPRKPRSNELTQFIRCAEIAPRDSKSPANRKKGTAISPSLSRLPNTAW